MKYILVLFLTLGLAGCSDFLEESSQDEVRPTTVDDLMQVMVGEAYPMDNIIDSYLDFLTDDMKCNGAQGDEQKSVIEQLYYIFSWNDDMYEKFESSNINSWQVYYSKIMGCNTVLGYLNRVTGEQNVKDNLKGQALVLRGWYYFLLVNLYGLPYNYGDPEENLGVPLKLEMEVTDAFYKRNTVAEVYAQIEKDLLEGIKLLDENNISMSLYKISPLAGKAMLSRVYLYMENWDKALEYANLVLDEKPALTALASADADAFQYQGSSSFGLYNWNVSDEVIWIYSGKREFSLYGGGGGTYPSVFSVSDDLMDLYNTSTDPNNHLDLRPYMCFYNSAYFSASFLPVLYPQYGYKGGKNQVYGTKGIRTAELYLNRAEVYIRKYMASGDDNYRKLALVDLNNIRKHRYDTRNVDYVDEDIQDADKLFQFYKEERRRELCFEDHRWFDLRRYGMPSLSHVYFVNSGNEQVITLNEGDLRYVLLIPKSALERNPRLIQNKR